MNIIFDGNYLAHKTFSVFSTYYKGQDMNQVLERKENRQIFLRKCVTDMCATVRRFEKDVSKVVFVMDSTSWRYNFYADYKYSLTRVRDSSYNGFLVCLNEFDDLLRSRGLIVSKIPGAEGDDLLYIWSLYFGYCMEEDTVIVTGDSDIRQIMSGNVSLFNNNSKNLKLYCVKEKERFWKDYLDPDVDVVVTDPFEVLLYKVVMGDVSDNVPKLLKGFGQKAFERFLEWLGPIRPPRDMDFIPFAQWISSRFSQFSGKDENRILGSVLFNLRMTWLNLSVYNNMNWRNKDGRGLLEHMLDDVNLQKDNNSYNKPYTLENFYGMVIK